jgi:hypothetical protein
MVPSVGTHAYRASTRLRLRRKWSVRQTTCAGWTTMVARSGSAASASTSTASRLRAKKLWTKRVKRIDRVKRRALFGGMLRVVRLAHRITRRMKFHTEQTTTMGW